MAGNGTSFWGNWDHVHKQPARLWRLVRRMRRQKKKGPKGLRQGVIQTRTSYILIPHTHTSGQFKRCPWKSEKFLVHPCLQSGPARKWEEFADKWRKKDKTWAIPGCFGTWCAAQHRMHRQMWGRWQTAEVSLSTQARRCTGKRLRNCQATFATGNVGTSGSSVNMLQFHTRTWALTSWILLCIAPSCPFFHLFSQSLSPRIERWT